MQKKRIIIGVVVFAAFVIAAAIALYDRIRSTDAVLGVPSGELAFGSDRTGVWDVFTLDPEGNLLNITDDGAGNDYFVSWVFTGDMLNMLSDRSGEIGPAQVKPDGSDLRTLSIIEGIMTVFLEGRVDWDPAWSPGGERIAWTSIRDFNLEIYIADSDNENRIRITDHSGNDWYPAWSPDGTQIAFGSDRDGNENLYIIDSNGENLFQLTDDPGDDLYPMWSLDGETILFHSDWNEMLLEGQLDLHIINVDGSNLHPLGTDEIFMGDPIYSADGQQIAYISNEEGDWNIYVMDADGENVRRVTGDDANDLFPVWRPVPEDSGNGE